MKSTAASEAYMAGTKTRSMRMTDEEWGDITKAAVHLGYGARGRSKMIIDMARKALTDAPKPTSGE